MKLSLIAIFLFSFLLVLNAQPLYADSVTHTWTGTGINGDNMLDVDDHGGSFDNGGNSETFQIVIDGVDQTASITLLLFDGVSVDDGLDIDMTPPETMPPGKISSTGRVCKS